MAEAKKGFVVAGSASGVGKTTVALALIAAYRRRGLVVQTFKCGPDFIDGGYHARAGGRASHNLDGWMLSAETNREIFFRGGEAANLMVVEGMMGLFDGVDGRSNRGSTSEIARWLGLPVILVVDASSMARSAAALVHGFATFDPSLRVAGVVFNRVAGPSHFQLLAEALSGGTPVRPLGYLPPSREIEIPERHLGLVTAREEAVPSSIFSLLGELAEQTIDLDALWELAAPISAQNAAVTSERRATVRIGVARDKAFSFYYEENLDALRRAGAEIVEFSPLADSGLPRGVDAVYFGGGYPEVFAMELAANQSMMRDVRAMAEEGLAMYAECGGLMYLAREIVTPTGPPVPMAAVLPLSVEMTERLVNFGYSEVSFTSDCLLGAAGGQARGHGFHCSRIRDAGQLESVYRAKNWRTKREEREGFRRKNVLASYIHLHFLSNPAMAHAFVESVERARSSRGLQFADQVPPSSGVGKS
ncbi:MAG TPA: cobyrinate a,c-diamide synthase [Terriglobales bacterium]|nr:cobyrinate a,c-diamide synthase [Terriglobales bacterium]